MFRSSRDEDDFGLVDRVFELVGPRKASRLRVWSAIVLVHAGLLVAVGGYVFLMGRSIAIAAATIEDGYQPTIYRWRPDENNWQNVYQITGRLEDAGSVVFDRQGAHWRCAPLVSARPDADRHPRVYYAASEANYGRARTEDRFAGELFPGSPTSYLVTVRSEATACGVPPDGYVLVDDGGLRACRAAGRSLLIIAGVIGSIALVAFLKTSRGQKDLPSAPAPLPG